MSHHATPYLIENGSLFRAVDGTVEAAPVALCGRIVATGAEALNWAESRSGLVRIDAAGATVMPGLIDAHCHISFDEPASNDELFFHRREGWPPSSRPITCARCCAPASPPCSTRTPSSTSPSTCATRSRAG
ncbi:hypothetical protein ACFSTI_06885 [Rhizorhabdus histidinilytica]